LSIEYFLEASTRISILTSTRLLVKLNGKFCDTATRSLSLAEILLTACMVVASQLNLMLMQPQANI